MVSRCATAETTARTVTTQAIIRTRKTVHQTIWVSPGQTSGITQLVRTQVIAGSAIIAVTGRETGQAGGGTVLADSCAEIGATGTVGAGS